jgi:F-type H+-transporting ATPase subunit a
MIALATLALTFGLAAHEGPPPSLPAEPAHTEQAAPAAKGSVASPEHAVPAAHAAAEHPAGVEAEHGGHEGEHEESLSDVMLEHVSDGYVVEYPGICHGGFHWDCEINFKHIFGDKLVFTVGGVKFDMTPSKHLIMMWLASTILLIAFVLSSAKRSLVPRGLYNFLELLVQFVRDEIARKNIGEHDGDRFVPYLMTAFFFILFMNLFGLIPYAATATGNLAVTMAMALFTFFITQYAAIRAQGIGGWLKHLTAGVAPWLWPIMVPVEILGLFTKPFALTIRLFANMLAGHIVILSLLGLIFALGTPFVAFGSIPMALLIFALELFVAFVQAYIFTMLSALFIGFGLAHHEPDGEEGEHGDHHHHEGSHVPGSSPGHG